MEAWLKSFFTSILLLIVIVIILRISFFYLTPFIIAILLAGFINPVVKKNRNLHWTGSSICYIYYTDIYDCYYNIISDFRDFSNVS